MSNDGNLIHTERIRYSGLLSILVVVAPLSAYLVHEGKQGFGLFVIAVAVIGIVVTSVYTKYFQNRMVIYRPLWRRSILYKDILEMKIVYGHYTQPMQLKISYRNKGGKKKTTFVPAPNSKDFNLIKKSWREYRPANKK